LGDELETTVAAHNFLVYGANGFVGEAITRMAVAQGLNPVIAGRNQAKIEALAKQLQLDYQVFSLDQSDLLHSSLKSVKVVLNCAGPFTYTYQPMVEACLATGTHYLDITGELPVFQAIADLDAVAKDRGVMLMPGVGFDVVPTDCLAVHLKTLLPSATHLTLAFQSVGPAGPPPGTQRTMIEMLAYSNKVRRNNQLITPAKTIKTKMIDFGKGPVTSTRITWGDVFTAWYSTGIPNIENYLVIPQRLHSKMKVLDFVRPIFRLWLVRDYLKGKIKPGSEPKVLAKTHTLVWGEVMDYQGNRKSARLRGPEAGVIWTGISSLCVVKKVLGGHWAAGYQTPGKVYGPDLVLESEEVTREDLT
jgi:short subunit dehydrogenase-like uncharacterized protein